MDRARAKGLRPRVLSRIYLDTCPEQMGRIGGAVPERIKDPTFEREIRKLNWPS